jgi:hypothetical protein
MFLPSCTTRTLAALQAEKATNVTVDTVWNNRSHSIRIPVWIVSKEGKTDAKALLDSGTEGIYINANYVKKHRFPLQDLKTPIYPRNVDGTPNKNSAIRHTAILWMEMGDNHRERIMFLVTDTGNHNILLGMDWLKAHNPNIDWAKNIIHMDQCPPLCQPWHTPGPTIAYLLPTCEWEMQIDDDTDVTINSIDMSQHIMAHMEQQMPEIARTMVSTALAMRKQTLPSEIPLEFAQYHWVFSDEQAQRLPKNQPWDHRIELIPGKEMGKTLIYWLTPPELQALKEYLEDGEKRGTLRRSKAPNACSFFFIDKKDGKLRPVVDYRPLNEITKKNAAPIPLIPELVDKLLGARFFTKLDIQWGYNNVRIHPDDIEKTAFKTPLGLFESLVMTFGLCNAPATFQTFMDTQFADIITTRHVVIYLDDILIFAETLRELTQLTHRVLQRIQDLDLFLRPAKCSFNQTSVEYLGLIISEGEIRMDLVKLKAIQDWPLPQTVKEVQKFLGFCNFYCRFVKDYSHIAWPLFNLTKKESPWNWTTECNTAFETLQQTMITSLVLMLLDHK